MLALPVLLLGPLALRVGAFRAYTETESDGNTTMLSTDPSSDAPDDGHITCPVLNAFVQNGDMTTDGDNVDAITVVQTLMLAGLNQPAYSGDPLPVGMTQSNAFEYTLGIFLKNRAGNYRDKDGDLTLPIHHFPGTNHEHNSQTGITTRKNVPFDEAQWEKLATRADSILPDGKDCFMRDAWARAMFAFESKEYVDGVTDRVIDNSQIREGHQIKGKAGTWGRSWAVQQLLSHGAEDGNSLGGKRLVAGVSQVFNGMINLFFTGDYGNVELYRARADYSETEDGQRGMSFPWLAPDYCLPVDELKELLVHGKYPTSSGYAAMTNTEFEEKHKVYKFPMSRCNAEYFQPGHPGYREENACVNGEPPLIDAVSKAKLKTLHAVYGKKKWMPKWLKER